MSTKVKTKVGSLKYVFIKGEGRNHALPGAPENMKFVASIVFKKDSPEHKHLLSLIDKEWDTYKKAHNVKGQPKTNGIKDEMQKDPDGKIDPATEEVQKIPTGNIIAQFKTNTKWPDGKPQVVRVFDKEGANITSFYQESDWDIGLGSTGVIFGTAVGNNVGGTHKVTLYLTAVQIATLSKYEGDTLDIETIDGADISIDDDSIPF